MSKTRHGKPWKKGAYSKKLIKPYSPNSADNDFMRAILLHEDSSVLAFIKPSGLACQTRNPDDRTLDKLLAVFAKSNGKQPRLVHRLDAQTSGVIITGRTKPAAAFLSAAFADRFAQKTYVAIVFGARFEETTGVIDAPLERYQEKPNLTLMRAANIGSKDFQEARTEYEVLSSAGGAHLLRLKPQTGRMHQLRAHLAHIKRPILGDPYYGVADQPKSEQIAPLRLMLHAYRLIMPHPDSGELDLKAPLPDDMKDMALTLGLDVSELA